MRKLVLFMHVSVDGFVAGPNGQMNWINVNEEIFDMAAEQTALSDTALYGRITYEMMDSYWPTAGNKPGASKHDVEHSGWYNRVEKVVLSRTMRDAERAKRRVISENVAEEVKKLKEAPGTNILVFGSPSAIHLLLKENLVDDLWLFINPVLLGNGIPLFTELAERRKLDLQTSKVFTGGVLCAHYSKIPE
jgi:dihydrofolate reductase